MAASVVARSHLGGFPRLKEARIGAKVNRINTAVREVEMRRSPQHFLLVADFTTISLRESRPEHDPEAMAR